MMNRQHVLSAVLMLVILPAMVQSREKQRVANEGTIGDKWMLADGVTLATTIYPPAFATRGDNVCIALGYLIAQDGTTSDFTVLKQWNSESADKEPVDGFWQAFAQAGADALSQWRFKPRPEVRVVMPTYTVATLGFQGRQDADPAEVRAHCKITDLADLLETIKAEPFERGDLLKQQQMNEQMRQQQMQREMMQRRANEG